MIYKKLFVVLLVSLVWMGSTYPFYDWLKKFGNNFNLSTSLFTPSKPFTISSNNLLALDKQQYVALDKQEYDALIRILQRKLIFRRAILSISRGAIMGVLTAAANVAYKVRQFNKSPAGQIMKQREADRKRLADKKTQKII